MVAICIQQNTRLNKNTAISKQMKVDNSEGSVAVYYNSHSAFSIILVIVCQNIATFFIGSPDCHRQGQQACITPITKEGVP